MVNVCILTGYGINAEAELSEAFRQQGAWVRELHLNDLMDNPSALNGFQILGVPGGFSFGDHLGSGKVFASLLRRYLRPQVAAFVADGKLVLGVCNGFQVLVKAGLLPDLAGTWEPEVSLIHNHDGTFVDRWVEVEWNAANTSPWIQDPSRRDPSRRDRSRSSLSRMDLPIRHGEGRFISGSPKVRQALVERNLVALRYIGHNPNGSEDDIAGITDTTGRILGLMPHPEAYLVAENHPRWSRNRSPGRDGSGPEEGPPTRSLFRNAVEFVKLSGLR